MEGIYFSQYAALALAIVIRAFIVAVRYGYSSDLRFQVIRSKRADAPFIIKDLLVVNWLEFHPDNLDIEIDSVFWRNQVEEHKFYFKFYETIDDDLA